MDSPTLPGVPAEGLLQLRHHQCSGVPEADGIGPGARGAESEAAALQGGGVGLCAWAQLVWLAFRLGISSSLAKLTQSLKTLLGSDLLILELRQLTFQALHLGEVLITGRLRLLQRFLRTLDCLN